MRNLTSPRVLIRKPVKDDWQELLSLNHKSRELHFPWVFPPLTKEDCQDYINRCQNKDFEGLLICHKVNQNIIGVVNLNQIVYKALQSAYLGYYAYADFTGKGFMSEGICLAINHAFYTLNLHRVEANIQPKNTNSIKLVKRIGFTKEGFSKRYLMINGEWCDHERWALTVEDWNY
ncbi:MAG: GNAT family N-acetyltransferase [Waterburya sp.]